MAGDRAAAAMAVILSICRKYIEGDSGRPRLVIDTRPLIRGRGSEMCVAGIAAGSIARRFHSTLVEMIVQRLPPAAATDRSGRGGAERRRVS